VFPKVSFSRLKFTLIWGLLMIPILSYSQWQVGIVYGPTLDKNYTVESVNHSFGLRFSVPIKERYAVICGIGYEEQILDPYFRSHRYDKQHYHNKLNKLHFSVEKRYKDKKRYAIKSKVGFNVNQVTYASTTSFYNTVISEDNFMHSLVLQGGHGIDLKLGNKMLIQFEPTMQYLVLVNSRNPYYTNRFRFSLNIGLAWIVQSS
jgi:hypothetical protein